MTTKSEFIGVLATVMVPGPEGTMQPALCRRVATRWMGESAEDLWEVLDGDLAGFKLHGGDLVEIHHDRS